MTSASQGFQYGLLKLVDRQTKQVSNTLSLRMMRHSRVVVARRRYHNVANVKHGCNDAEKVGLLLWRESDDLKGRLMTMSVGLINKK